MKSTPPYPAILLSLILPAQAGSGPAPARGHSAVYARPFAISSQGNDLLRVPFQGCVPFGHNSNAAIVASRFLPQQPGRSRLDAHGAERRHFSFQVLKSFCSARICAEKIFGAPKAGAAPPQITANAAANPDF